MRQHVRLHFGDDGQIPTGAEVVFGLLVNIPHVTDHDVGMESQAFETIFQAGFEQVAFRHAGRGRPTDQRHQQDERFKTIEP